MHEKLWQIVRRLNTDYEPFGKAEREGPDCSGGCRLTLLLVAIAECHRVGTARTERTLVPAFPNSNRRIHSLETFLSSTFA
jgi:hypothetical protein